MDFFSIFGIGSLIIIACYFAKELGKKMPIGCLIISLLILFCFIKACSDLKEEEREREEWNRKFQEELEYKDRQWRKRSDNTAILMQNVDWNQTNDKITKEVVENL